MKTVFVLSCLLLVLSLCASDEVVSEPADVVSAAENYLSVRDKTEARRKWEKEWAERAAETNLTEETKAKTMASNWFFSNVEKFRELEKVSDEHLTIACRIITWFDKKRFTLPELVSGYLSANETKIVRVISSRAKVTAK